MMKFTDNPKKQTIVYRLCDEVSCRSIAIKVMDADEDNGTPERQLCESHWMRYRAELKDASKSL